MLHGSASEMDLDSESKSASESKSESESESDLGAGSGTGSGSGSGSGMVMDQGAGDGEGCRGEGEAEGRGGGCWIGCDRRDEAVAAVSCEAQIQRGCSDGARKVVAPRFGRGLLDARPLRGRGRPAPHLAA